MRRGVAILYAFVFYPLLVAYTGAAVPLLALLVAAGAPFAPHRENMRRFRRMIAWYGYGVVRGLARPVIRIVYESPARSPRAAKIFVSNHVASSDPFLVSLLPEATVQVVNLWPFKLPVWGVFARWAGYLNIRAMSAEAFQAAAASLLAEGISIVAFPEGTRSRTGVPLKPKAGIGFLAAKSGAPVLPVRVRHTELFPRPARMTVTFGEPLRYAGDGGRESCQAFAELVMETIYKL